MAKIMKDGKPSTSFSRQDREWVKSMRGGDTPAGTINITENGEYDVTSYATADVQVEGGSSDFSTAEVTVTNNTGGAVKIEAPMVDTEENSTVVVKNVFTSDPVTLTIVLYEGLAFGGVANGEEYSYTLTGGIEGESGELVITGNGTILIEAGAT